MTQSQAAFQALVDLAQRSRRSARGLPSQTKVQPQWSGVGFSLSGKHFVTPLGEVTELLEMPTYTKLPGVQDWVLGVANVRGRLLPMVDLAAFLGGRLEGQRKRHRVLVLEVGDLYTGLVVDTALGMQHFLVESFAAEVDDLKPELRPYVTGRYLKSRGNGKDQAWYVFSPLRLAEDPRFINAAR